jgi:YggT family protein
MAVLRLLVLAYILCIFGVIILSWFPQEPGGVGNRIFVALRRVTDPVLAPLRRVIPPIGGMIDLSPMIVLFVLYTIYYAL